MDDLKQAWLTEEDEKVRCTSRSRILLLRAAGATEALDARATLREAGLRNGDTLWVRITQTDGASVAR